MKLSTRARYALRCMMTISSQSEPDRPVSLAHVAKSGCMSKRYLEQLAMKLREASLIRGVGGRKGGYVLARPPKDITVAEVVEATIGPINVVECVLHPETCDKSDTCECRMLYLLINAKVGQVLNEFTLADLTDKKWNERITSEVAAIQGAITACPEEADGGQVMAS